MSVSSFANLWRTRYVHPCDWDQTFAPLSLPDMFAQSVAAHPDAPLVRFGGRAFSYRAMEREALSFAAGLRDIGIAPGDRVGLFLPNVPVYVPAYFGAMIAGATVVNFSPLYSAEELEAQVADSGTRLIVTTDVAALLPTALEVLDGSSLEKLVVAPLAVMLPWPKAVLLRLLGRRQLAAIPRRADVHRWRNMLSERQIAPHPVDPLKDLALLQYTGGTTGTPKGAMLTHQNLSANARQVRAIDPDVGERDVTLAVLPLFHVFANTCVLNRTLLNGGCLVMQPRFEAHRVLAGIREHRPTSLFVVPTMLQAFLDDPRIEGTDFSSIREIISGGAPLALPLKERFEAMTGACVIEGYGLTESSGVVTTNPLREGARAGTIGQPVPGTQLRLLDKDDPERDAAAGEPGELAIRGPQVMQGYWNRPEAAAAAFVIREGAAWLRTGDIAVIEEDGFVRVVDRSKDMIAVGGFKVFPSQVEAVLVQHPAIKQAAVIGVPDAYLGERPRAYVTLREGGAESADTLRDWLNDRIGKHEKVDAVVIRTDMPLTMVGKLDRKALREQVLREQVLSET